jgi:urease accessory protein
MLNDSALLYLLQLASSALPVGAYSYSEGLELLVERGAISNQKALRDWIIQELHYGAIRIEAAVMLRVHQSVCKGDLEALMRWNMWLSAMRETEELRQQSWQMGQSLHKLLLEIFPQIQLITSTINSPHNFAAIFGIATAFCQIHAQAAVLGYLHSWVANLISAGVKLIPLGQTSGQMLLSNLNRHLSQITIQIITLEDDELSSCGWGLALASMAHETQYTRLFRS